MLTSRIFRVEWVTGEGIGQRLSSLPWRRKKQPVWCVSECVCVVCVRECVCMPMYAVSVVYV